MGRFAVAIRSHRKHAYYAKEGYDTLIRNEAKVGLAKAFQDMIDAIDDEFDADDQKEYEWVKANDPD